ncbi:MAG: hypothetical protein K9M07_03830 [Simkaniaceae bacterium]|nr:hypothetical protein [Simkaniaceae bacterium]
MSLFPIDYVTASRYMQDLKDQATRFAPVISGVGFACRDYTQSTKMQTMGLDGDRLYETAMIGSERLNSIGNQFEVLTGSSLIGYVSVIPIGVAITIYIKKKYEQIEEFKTGLSEDQIGLKYLCDAMGYVEKLAPLGEVVLDFLPAFLDGLATAAYVAMGVFGHEIVAGVGLSLLGMAVLKRNGYLPAVIDNYLQQLITFVGVFAPFFGPMSSLSAAYTTFEAFFYIYERLPPLMSDEDPLPKHVICEDKKLTSERWDAFLRGAHDLQLNPTSIYSKDLTVLSAEEEAEIEEKSLTDCFGEVRSRLISEGLISDKITFTDTDRVRSTKAIDTEVDFDQFKEEHSLELSYEQYLGFKRIKGACDGWAVDSDYAGGDRTSFEKLLKMTLLSIAHSDDFKSKFCELSEIGNQCAEGWIREIQYFLEPKTDNARWHIHYQLALVRSALIRESVREIADEDGVFKAILDTFEGGSNNVHFIHNVELGMRQFVRSYAGEMMWNQMSISPFYKYFLTRIDDVTRLYIHCVKYFANLPEPSPEEYKEIRGAFQAQAVGLCVPSSGLLVPQFLRIEKKVHTAYTPDLVVDHVHTMSMNKTIPWGPTASLLGEIQEKIGIEVLGEDDEYSSEWVASLDIDGKRSYHLTEKGSQLVLWYLSILELKPA